MESNFINKSKKDVQYGSSFSLFHIYLKKDFSYIEILFVQVFIQLMR